MGDGLGKMSGRSWRGSSGGSGRRTMTDGEPVRSTMRSASARMVNFTGLPRLIGPASGSGAANKRMRPSTMSST
jgi:hypothetical protein